MRVNYDRNITTQGDLGGQRTNMTFDENSMEHIMGLLTDLYSNPEMAVIREYSTNAIDSHKAAGNNNPIEVTTPSDLNPYLRIKDYGVGLSVDDLTGIYSKYGASTKRDNDIEAGMLGLGCKSALSYTNQFTLNAIKNGVKATVLVSRNEKGAGVVEVVDTVSTDEPNGVEVVIPCKNASSVIRHCNTFFRFWERGTVLVNDEEPGHVDGMWVNDNIVIVDSLENDYVVMGNVPYPVSGNAVNRHILSSNLHYRKKIVAWVPMGSVNFTPSREELHYTNLTNTTINKVKKDLEDGLVDAAVKAVENASNHAEAWVVAKDWRHVKSNFAFKYKGQEIPSEFNNVDLIKFNVNAHRYGAVREYRISAYDLSDVSRIAFVENFPNVDLSSNNRAKIRRYLDDNNLAYRTIYLSDDVICSPWLDNIDRIDWNDVAAVKLNKKQNAFSIKAMPGSYDVFDRSSKRFKESDNITSKKIMYYSSAEKDVVDPWIIEKIFNDYEIVRIPKNRWEKFKRDYPVAEHVSKVVSKRYKELLDQLSDQDKILLTADKDTAHVASLSAINDIEDPDLKNYLLTVRNNELSDAAKNLKAVTKIHGTINAIPFEKLYNFDTTNPLEKYSVVTARAWRGLNEEEIECINALYYYRNKENSNEV